LKIDDFERSSEKFVQVDDSLRESIDKIKENYASVQESMEKELSCTMNKVSQKVKNEIHNLMHSNNSISFEEVNEMMLDKVNRTELSVTLDLKSNK
jgi:gas vesicle protein